MFGAKSISSLSSYQKQVRWLSGVTCPPPLLQHVPVGSSSVLGLLRSAESWELWGKLCSTWLHKSLTTHVSRGWTYSCVCQSGSLLLTACGARNCSCGQRSATGAHSHTVPECVLRVEEGWELSHSHFGCALCFGGKRIWSVGWRLSSSAYKYRHSMKATVVSSVFFQTLENSVG